MGKVRFYFIFVFVNIIPFIIGEVKINIKKSPTVLTAGPLLWKWNEEAAA
jgi:hypothetical protein